MKARTRIIIGLIGFLLLIGASILWGNYNNLFIPAGFAGLLMIGAAGTTNGTQVKE